MELMGSVRWIQQVAFESIFEYGQQVAGLFPVWNVVCLFRQATAVGHFTDTRGLNQTPVKTRVFTLQDVTVVLNDCLQRQNYSTLAFLTFAY